MAVVHLQAVHFLLDGGCVLAKEFNLVVEFGELVEDLVLVFLVDLTEVDDFVRAVLSQKESTVPNMPQSEQMASLQSSQ